MIDAQELRSLWPTCEKGEKGKRGEKDTQELLYWWQLWQAVPGVGWHRFYQLLSFCKRQHLTLAEVWDSGKVLENVPWPSSIKNNLKNINKDLLINEYQKNYYEKKWLVIPIFSPRYPPQLLELPDPPWLLYLQGQLPNWQQLGLAMVGTRRATPYGEQVVNQLVQELSFLDGMVISGFMYGIDCAAHRAALKFGVPTVGVLGYGFQQVQPAWMKKLYQEWLSQGMSFISEYAPDTPACKGCFPRRNRIVAGLARAVLVVEAALKSGSHITAHHALELGKPIGAVPGSIFNPYSAGTQWLINQGAVMVRSIKDLVSELPEYSNLSQNCTPSQESLISSAAGLTALQHSILSEISEQGLPTDVLVSRMKASTPVILGTLSTMEIAGMIKRHQGKWYISR